MLRTFGLSLQPDLSGGCYSCRLMSMFTQIMCFWREHIIVVNWEMLVNRTLLKIVKYVSGKNRTRFISISPLHKFLSSSSISCFNITCQIICCAVSQLDLGS